MDYKVWILKLLGEIEDSDVLFLNQIYTIMKKHVEKNGGKEQVKKEEGQQDYIGWVLRLVMTHSGRARDIYYVLLGLLGDDI